jgi:hypothetical protein
MYWPSIERNPRSQPRVFDWSAQDANTIADINNGLAIDAILGLESFDGVAALGEAAPRAYGELGVGMVRHEGGPVTLLDVARVLDALKRGGEGR